MFCAFLRENTITRLLLRFEDIVEYFLVIPHLGRKYSVTVVHCFTHYTLNKGEVLSSVRSGEKDDKSKTNFGQIILLTMRNTVIRNQESMES